MNKDVLKYLLKVIQSFSDDKDIEKKHLKEDAISLINFEIWKIENKE